ncbi:MAG: TIGR03826 family flagellar region protein [Sporolactobacillus sp.]
MADLANCVGCGKLFVRTTSPYCPECQKEQEQKFEKVYRYITSRDHRKATVVEVHEATEVETELIYTWIGEGRLKTSIFPNLSYPCKSCGKMITEGVICASCREKIEKEISQTETVSNQQIDNLTYHTRTNR